jgi:hypothetical protein
MSVSGVASQLKRVSSTDLETPVHLKTDNFYHSIMKSQAHEIYLLVFKIRSRGKRSNGSDSPRPTPHH